MDFGAARNKFARDVEYFMLAGEGNTRILPENGERNQKRNRFSLRRKRNPKKAVRRVTRYMQAHMTAVLPDAPTEIDPYRTHGGIFSAETEKIEADITLKRPKISQGNAR